MECIIYRPSDYRCYTLNHHLLDQSCQQDLTNPENVRYCLQLTHSNCSKPQKSHENQAKRILSAARHLNSAQKRTNLLRRTCHKSTQLQKTRSRLRQWHTACLHRLHNRPIQMKIRPTRSRTRQGVLNWLQKLNPFMPIKCIYNDSDIVAVRIHKITGAIIYYEFRDGGLIDVDIYNRLSSELAA